MWPIIKFQNFKYTSNQPVLCTEWLRGTEISVFWTKCMCPPQEVKLNFAVKFWSDCSQTPPPPPRKWSWTLSAVKFQSDCSQTPPTEVKLNFVCSEVLKWLQSDFPPRKKWSWTLSAVKFWSDCSQTPPPRYPTWLQLSNFKYVDVISES